ncbi:MAG: CPBP family intramembrane metalloprotease [Pirellulales bacterium]|nr:CPBP family intramembrane metalloprotease [Pirellulales bacterium]
MDEDSLPPPSFLVLAVAFESGLAVVALAAGWALGFSPSQTIHWNAAAIGAGALAALPPLLLFWACVTWPVGPLAEIVRVVDHALTPLFRHCRIVDLAAISAVAGVGEELLFRGLVQGGIAHWIGGSQGTWIGLLVGSVVFGMVHPITRTYALLAGLIGLYLGGLWLATGNLVAPIAAHAVYDFLALVYLARLRRRPPEARDPTA